MPALACFFCMLSAAWLGILTPTTTESGDSSRGASDREARLGGGDGRRSVHPLAHPTLEQKEAEEALVGLDVAAAGDLQQAPHLVLPVQAARGGAGVEQRLLQQAAVLGPQPGAERRAEEAALALVDDLVGDEAARDPLQQLLAIAPAHLAG